MITSSGIRRSFKDEVLPAMIDLDEEEAISFDLATEASINLADDEQLIRQMIQAGFEGVFCRYETPMTGL